LNSKGLLVASAIDFSSHVSEVDRKLRYRYERGDNVVRS
jgi:hypothetical protein